MNIVIVSGNLGADPELRVTGSGKSVVNLRLAVNEGSGDKRVTHWFRVVVWEAQADSCNKYLAKGSKVLVEGRLQTRDWQDKDGNKRVDTEIVAGRVEFLDFKPREEGDEAAPPARPAYAQTGPPRNGPGLLPKGSGAVDKPLDLDGDLPF